MIRQGGTSAVSEYKMETGLSGKRGQRQSCVVGKDGGQRCVIRKNGDSVTYGQTVLWNQTPDLALSKPTP